MPEPRAVPPEVTICITSCGRLDLLAETLETERIQSNSPLFDFIR